MVDDFSTNRQTSIDLQHLSSDVPPQRYQTLRRIIPKRLHPFLRGLRKSLLKEGYRNHPPFKWVYSYTQASLPRQDRLYKNCCNIVENGIAGDFVECGVLDGGTAAIMAYAAREDKGRKLHLFDAWKGLPQSGEKDGKGSAIWVGDVVGSPRRVRKVLRKVGANIDNVTFHHGWFDATFPQADIPVIALLHIDCDFYDSVKLCLETWVPRVASGGIVQIDDYMSFEGCRRAVDEFLEAYPEWQLIIEDKPGGAIWFVKT